MPYHSPISDRNPEPNNRQLLILLGLFFTVILIVIISLFFIVNQLVNLIPISLEKQIGQLIVNELVIPQDNSTIEQNLNILVDRLEQHIPADSKGKRDYEVRYIAENTINALAVPGDVIIIYQGLLNKMDSENELVMVLGHEIGHFAHRDHLRSLGNTILIQLLLSFFFDWGNISNYGINLTNHLINAQYSQTQEINADIFGLDLLNKYYGHVAGATDFFRKLKAENHNNEQIAFLSTHPLPKKRIKKLEQLIKTRDYSWGEKVSLHLCD